MFGKKEDIPPRRFQMTGAVLTGGGSRRLGFNKAFAEVGGVPIVERVLGVLGALFEKVVIVTLDPEDYEHLGYPVFTDILPGNNALGGIHAALSFSSTDKTFICACDMPFLNAHLVAHLAELSPEADVVVPMSQDRLEPLHAAYGKGCLPAIEKSIEEGNLRLSGFFPHVTVRVVEGSELERLDPEGRSFFNVNTAEDLETASALALKEALPPSVEGRIE